MADLDNDAAGAEGFSELEMEFFREGDAMSAEAEANRVMTRESRPAQRRGVENDDDGDWQIAIARARVSQPG